MYLTHVQMGYPEKKEFSMKTSVSKPNRSKVLAAQQPKTTQEPVPQQAHDIPRPKSVPITMPTPEDIAKRAYEIYLEKGSQQGQCEQNWIQAEQELTKGLKIIFA
jgi:hypothetical protein